MGRDAQIRNICRFLLRNIQAFALFLCVLTAMSSAFSLTACNNVVTRSPSTATATTAGGLPGLNGGVLPSGSSLNAITIINATPSVSSSGGQMLDVIGQNDEIATYCTSTSACQCQFRWTDPVSGSPLQAQQALDYLETNLLRCSYGQVPSNVSQFTVSVLILSGGLSSNELVMNFPASDASQDTTNAANYLSVTRYQCKDLITTNTNFYQRTLLDPQAWLLSLSYNLYSTNLGQDYGGATNRFECPVNPTDETVTKYNVNRYWPDNSQVVGPLGLDGRCTTIETDCPGGSTWANGTSGSTTLGFTFNATTNEYNSRSRIFGTANPSNTYASTDGTIENEPYDMALYSAKPLSNYDNVIYPTRIDESTKTSVGIQNGSSCFTGTEAGCTCVSGRERDCRKFKANRHDFYVANFYNNTFKYPFCMPHTVGGATGRNNLQTALDCSVDTSQSPLRKGPDVLGFVAYPDSSGRCPNTSLPRGKKWALAWKFRHSFEPRRLIDVVNPNDVGDLFCTTKEEECSPATSGGALQQAKRTTNNSAANNGVTYCLTGASYGDYKVGAVQEPSSAAGSRYGNCLDVAASTTAGGTTGYCANIDGSAPWSIDAGATTTYSALRYQTAATAAPGTSTSTGTDGGCFDPAFLYTQFSTFLVSGFFNWYDSTTTTGCRAWTQASAALAITGYSHTTTFDWQGFPFIAGDSWSKPALSSPDTIRGVGYGGNWCNPSLPGARWSGSQTTTATGAFLGADTNAIPGWADGVDVWLVGNGAKGACVEADVDSSQGFLYNSFAHTSADPSTLRLPGSVAIEGFVGLVGQWPKTIKNWFDFVGIGCSGMCDNSSASNSYPPFPWQPGISYHRGSQAAGYNPIADFTLRSGPHSSTDSWGGYGIFSFGTTPVDSSSPSDILLVVTPEGITPSQMETDLSVQLQYKPIRYINGIKVEYDLDAESLNTSNPAARLPVYPMCVLQDNGET